MADAGGIDARLVGGVAAEVFRYDASGRQTERLAASAFAMLYVGLLFSFVIQLRFAGPNADWGLAALASLLLIVKLSDIGAVYRRPTHRSP